MKIKTILLSLATFSILCANQTEIIKQDSSKTFNQVDDKYNDEKGFAFYIDDKNNKKQKKAKKDLKCDCNKLLEKLESIEKENKEQTKIQTKIYELLESKIHPKAKMITVNGKKCLANSSRECYKMPIMGDMREIPAFVNWMNDPSPQNTYTYLRWQSKHIQEIGKRGASFPLAKAQFGKDAYPLPSKPMGYLDIKGFNIKDKMTKNMILSNKDKFNFLIFFGKNKDLDIISAVSMIDLIKKYKDLNFTIIFKDKNSEKLYHDTINSIYASKMKTMLYSEKHIVDSKAFKKYNIYTTPSVVVVDNKEKKAQTLSTGRIDTPYFEQMFQNYLEYTGKLDYTKLMTTENWDATVNKRGTYFKRRFGIDINNKLNITKDGVTK